MKRNTYSRSNSYIAGYGHPLYSDSAVEEPTKPTAEAETSTVTCIVSIPQLKNGVTGAAVKNAQTLLIAKGYPCGGKVRRTGNRRWRLRPHYGEIREKLPGTEESDGGRNHRSRHLESSADRMTTKKHGRNCTLAGVVPAFFIL